MTPMVSNDWPAPAKLNLFLHVTGRRVNGYHELQMVFQLLDRGDALDFATRADGQITRQPEIPGVPHEADLVVRAAKALQTASGCVQGADIHLHKITPMGGGLGGGSSDAATTLVALNALWNCGFSEDQLAEMGLALGADVPVFVRGHSAWAEGVGETLTPLELPEAHFAVVCPPVSVSTAEIFSAPELTRNTPKTTIPRFLSGAGRNDCESVVCARVPEVADTLHFLREHASVLWTRMTGTGACCFAVCASEEDANQVVNDLPRAWMDAGWSAWIAQGRNRSPLLDRLEQFRHEGS
ncbi:MAG: 4-(cytidine 5'-diphospho)-2-C-methyl-D-erythritol kinase [Gammaproteobacteria bacterium]